MRRAGSDNVITPAPVDPHEIVLRRGAETMYSCSTVFPQQQDHEQDHEQDNEQGINRTCTGLPATN